MGAKRSIRRLANPRAKDASVQRFVIPPNRGFVLNSIGLKRSMTEWINCNLPYAKVEFVVEIAD